MGTLGRRIYLALDCFACHGGVEHSTLYLGEGHIGQPPENAFVSCSLSVVNTAHQLPRYPLAYSIIVLPLSITRWLSFKHEDKVPSAATFFSVSVFNLSGAINVLLFLVVRPELLLFDPSKRFRDSQITDQSTNPAILAETTNYNYSPQPTGRELTGDGEWNPPRDSNEVVLSPIEPIRPRLEDLEGI